MSVENHKKNWCDLLSKYILLAKSEICCSTFSQQKQFNMFEHSVLKFSFCYTLNVSSFKGTKNPSCRLPDVVLLVLVFLVLLLGVLWSSFSKMGWVAWSCSHSHPAMWLIWHPPHLSSFLLYLLLSFLLLLLSTSLGFIGGSVTPASPFLFEVAHSYITAFPRRISSLFLPVPLFSPFHHYPHL